MKQRCSLLRSRIRYQFAIVLFVAPWVFGLSTRASAEDTQEASRLSINVDGVTYDSHPSSTTTADGATWFAWHAYRDGRDQILARRIGPDRELGQLLTVTEHAQDGDAHGPPAIAPAKDGVWIVWSSLEDGSWHIIARQCIAGQRQTSVVISREGSGVQPTVIDTEDGTICVAWSAYHPEGCRIHARCYDGQQWQPPFIVSGIDGSAQRPALAIDGGDVWAFWDVYSETSYSIRGRRILPSLGSIQIVSPSDDYCLAPTALKTSAGLAVAWLRKSDVIGGPGVISQWHTLQVATPTPNGWSLVADDRGRTAAAELTHGLMAKISPRPEPTGGYLGSRAKPMLIATEDSSWLLWERKSDHSESTFRVSGELVGRQFSHGRWSSPVILHRGMVDYHAMESSSSDGTRVNVIASQLPRHSRRIYSHVVCDLEQAAPFQQDRWEGWTPVRLPRPEQVVTRRDVCDDERTYHLYWADLHCHSAMTADAEGEPDELLHYARDRALLDIVAFTNNDFLYDVPLTQYEYATSNFLAAHYSRPDFLALPGYEWTSRIPGISGVPASDAGSWTPPYQHESFPNHRSVIYSPAGGPVVRFSECDNDVDRLNEAVQRAGGITLTQHDAFRPTGHPVEVAMELTSGWRRYIQRRPELFHDALRQGNRLGFVACGDTHRRAPGLSGALTGIYAEALTGDAILDALRQRRCFATSGSRIAIDARANGALMGQQIHAETGHVLLTLRVDGTRPLDNATLIRNGDEIEHFQGDGGPQLSVTHEEDQLPPGTHWYYWRVAQQPETPDLPGNLNPALGHLAWTSPHWVVVGGSP